MKVYISGKITGTSDYIERFAQEEKKVRAYFPFDIEVVNPVEICKDIPTDAPWTKFMRRCVKHLTDCDAIHMMKDWEASKGATEEKRIAEMLGLSVVCE